MKTISPETEYHGIETEEESSPGSLTTQESSRRKPKELLLKQGENKFNNVNESLGYNESESLIICNSDLASSFQVVKTEKNKLNPGHYLHKVFLNGVAQKFRSQSLPSCLEKKKYQQNGGGIVSENVRLCEESDETQTGKSSCDQNGYCKVESKETSNNDSRFKTWPERGIDKVQSRKTEAGYEIGNSNCQKTIQRSDDNLNYSNVKNQNTERAQKVLYINGDIKQEDIERRMVLNASSSSKSAKNSCGKVVTLNEVLNKFPLAYSPVTRQLHIITESDKSKECNTGGEEESDASFLTCLLASNNLEDPSSGDKTCRGWAAADKNFDTSDFASTLQRVGTEVSSFSSTVSSLSDNSPSTNEDSALGSLLDHGDSCSLVSVGGCSVLSEESNGAKPKKKSFSGFFSRNVFGWKSGSRGSDASTYFNTSTDNTANAANSVDGWNKTSASAYFNTSQDSAAGGLSGWKLFGKSSSATLPHQSLASDQYPESDCFSLAPDSPCSIRSTSSGTSKFSHENRVASSSALIQLDRPANLPAKSQDEELRHRQEYQEMVEAARKKELKEAKQKKKLLQMQLKAEEQLAQATKVWTQDILPKWDQMCSSRKARDLWWQGVPPCVRGKVWQLAIGNSLNITHSLYDIYVSRAQDRLKSTGVSSDEETADNKEASMQLIQLDISRTFPHLCIFQQGGPYYDMLHSLLAAYVCYRPDVGYVQGMSFIAAVLILNMEAADAFVCFANLLNRPCHMAFFRLNQPLMQAYYATYNDLLKENLPKIYDHFNSTTLTPDLYLLDYIYTVFTKAMGLDLACRVWDVFLRDGEQFLFRTALGVLHLCQDSLLQMDFVHGSQFLTRLPDDLSANQLFKSIAAIKMSVGKQNFYEILASHTQSVTKQASVKSS